MGTTIRPFVKLSNNLSNCALKIAGLPDLAIDFKRCGDLLFVENEGGMPCKDTA